MHAFDVFPYGFLGALISLGLGKKIIITAIGSGSIVPLYHYFQARLARWALRRADKVIAISRFTRAEILKKVPRRAIEVINPGVDADFFGDTQTSRYDAARYKPYIASVGQLRWRKGYHFSIRGFAKVAARFPALHYVIVGKKYKEDYYMRLCALIKELHLEGRVFILEDVATREELADVYREAELFCLFSQNVNHDVEGFGQVFLEAAAAGLPVVGSKNCGIDDAVRDGENGILVPTRSADDFADAILAILCDEKLKKEMGMRSRAFARASGWEQRIEEYVDVYQQMRAFPVTSQVLR